MVSFYNQARFITIYQHAKRVLFFDVLRIGAVAAIVLYHIALIYNFHLFSDGYYAYNLYHLTMGLIGVGVMVFISGAVLEFTHPHLEGFDNIAEFYVKRLARIYPAFWMSLIIAIATFPFVLQNFSLWKELPEIVGLSLWSGFGNGQINGVGWFFSLIIPLYFLFPIISPAIKKHPYQMLFLITIVELTMRFYLNTYPQFFNFGGYYINFNFNDYWFPLCSLLEFSLGIFIVQQGIYPGKENSSSAILFLADLSFYVFLLNYIIGFHYLMQDSLMVYIASVALFSWMLMLADKQVQAWLKKVLLSSKPS